MVIIETTSDVRKYTQKTDMRKPENKAITCKDHFLFNER
jgi:hypothetical protein